MKKSFEIQIPIMPNYLLLDIPVNVRTADPPKIGIEELTEAEAREFVALWSEAFMKQWTEKKMQPVMDLHLSYQIYKERHTPERPF